MIDYIIIAIILIIVVAAGIYVYRAKKADGNVLVAQMVVPVEQKKTGMKVVAVIRQISNCIFVITNLII